MSSNSFNHFIVCLIFIFTYDDVMENTTINHPIFKLKNRKLPDTGAESKKYRRGKQKIPLVITHKLSR